MLVWANECLTLTTPAAYFNTKINTLEFVVVIEAFYSLLILWHLSKTMPLWVQYGILKIMYRISCKIEEVDPINPFPNNPWFLCVCFYVSFENTVGKGEIACNKQFLLFPQCFLPLWITFCHFQTWNCRLQSLWVWKSLKFDVWERVKLISLKEVSVSVALKYNSQQHIKINRIRALMTATFSILMKIYIFKPLYCFVLQVMFFED